VFPLVFVIVAVIFVLIKAMRHFCCHLIEIKLLALVWWKKAYWRIKCVSLSILVLMSFSFFIFFLSFLINWSSAIYIYSCSFFFFLFFFLFWLMLLHPFMCFCYIPVMYNSCFPFYLEAKKWLAKCIKFTRGCQLLLKK
jgi:hypothetical protein